METITAEGHEQLRVANLTIEYSSGGYAVRPIDGLDLEIPTGSLCSSSARAAAARPRCSRRWPRSSSLRVARSSSATPMSPPSRETSSATTGCTRSASSSSRSTCSRASARSRTSWCRCASRAPEEDREAARRATRLGQSRRSHRAQTQRPVRRPATAGRHRACARDGTEPRARRRTDRAPRLHPGRGRHPASAHARATGPDRGRLDPRRTTSPLADHVVELTPHAAGREARRNGRSRAPAKCFSSKAPPAIASTSSTRERSSSSASSPTAATTSFVRRQLRRLLRRTLTDVPTAPLGNRTRPAKTQLTSYSLRDFREHIPRLRRAGDIPGDGPQG